MSTKPVVGGLAAVGIGFVAAFSLIGASGACGTTTPECTPDEQGLGGATPLTIRRLAQPPVRSEACTRPRVEVIRDSEELQKVYDELGISSSAADGGADSVDFTRERVIVREGPSGQGISWAVAQGETGVVGILSCSTASRAACSVELIAVPALITRVESRTCDPVRCGTPLSPPGRRL